MSSSDLFMLGMLHSQNKLYWFERSVTLNGEFTLAGHLADWSFERIMALLINHNEHSEILAISGHEIIAVDLRKRVHLWKRMPPRLEDVASIKALRR